MTASQRTDRMWMARALELARRAWACGEVPVGAVLVRAEPTVPESGPPSGRIVSPDIAAPPGDAGTRHGTLIAEDHNRTVEWSDPTAHAEVVAIRKAARRQGDWRLDDLTLYVTLEPCAQCAGSIVLARIPRLVYGASDPKAGMAGSLGNLVQDPRLNHRVRVTAGVLADASSALLKGFFRERRGK